MPRYRMDSGVVVDVPEETAALISGLIPEDEKSPPAKKAAAPAKKAVPRTPAKR